MLRRSLLLLGLALGAFSTNPARSEETPPALGTEIAFDLIDSDGRTVRAIDFRGRWLLVFFGYTYCPDLCPTTLNEMAEVAMQIGPQAAQIQPIFVSIDPERDTPQVLHAYVTGFDERILALTGSREQIERAAKAFGIVSFKVSGAADKDYTFAHSAFLTVVGPEGGLVTRFSADERSVGIASALKALMQSGG